MNVVFAGQEKGSGTLLHHRMRYNTITTQFKVAYRCDIRPSLKKKGNFLN